MNDSGRSFRRLPDGTVVSQPGDGQPPQTGTSAGSSPSQPESDATGRRLRGCLIAVAVVVGAAVLAVVALAWLLLSGVEFDERARQTVAAEAAAGRAAVELGDDEVVAVPLAVCDADALQRLADGDAGEGLVLGGRHAPTDDRQATVQLSSDGRWKLQSRWDGHHRVASLAVTAHRAGNSIELVDAGGVEDGVKARVSCR